MTIDLYINVQYKTECDLTVEIFICRVSGFFQFGVLYIFFPSCTVESKYVYNFPIIIKKCHKLLLGHEKCTDMTLLS